MENWKNYKLYSAGKEGSKSGNYKRSIGIIISKTEEN
jgi:hypothetical protein